MQLLLVHHFPVTRRWQHTVQAHTTVLRTEWEGVRFQTAAHVKVSSAWFTSPSCGNETHTLCLAGETFIFSWHSAPWRNPVPTHSGQSCHKDTHRTPTVNHIWQRPGVVTFTGTLKGDMEWPSVTEWNLFSCCMYQLFPSLIPAPHSAHSGLHSLFLPYTSGLIFLIAWYPSPRYIAKSLSLKNCPVITVWLNTHLWDKNL